MKVSKLVLLALLGVASASKVEHKHHKSLTERAQQSDIVEDLPTESEAAQVDVSSVDADDENTSISTLNKKKVKVEKDERMTQIRNEINSREGSQKNQDLFKNINDKLSDKSFIEQAIETSAAGKSPLPTTVTNEARPLDLVRGSDDLFHMDQSQHDRNTDTLGTFQKDSEQNYFQGNGNTGKTNSPSLQSNHISLPNSWQRVAPVNQPKHLMPGDFKKATAAVASKSGISLAYLDIDSEEHATRFIKDLFHNGLVAAVQMMEGGYDRSYLKFGTPSTETKRVRLEMTVKDDNVAKLIDYTNNNNPTQYDYPVPNVTVVPVTLANPAYVKWANESGKIDYKKIKYAKYPDQL